MGSKHVCFSLVLACSVLFVMCKGPEKTGSYPTASKCKQLIENLSQDSLYFVGKMESKKEEIATIRAEKKAVIQLVQFFQSEFIEGGQLDLFSDNEIKTRSIIEQNEQLRKIWSEKSYQLIGQDHNHNTFTHKPRVREDSSGTFIARNVLRISEDWIRAHWERTLAATDKGFYIKAKESKYYQQLMEMDIQQEHPCK